MAGTEDTNRIIAAETDSARRLLAAAIRMYFAKEDEVAIGALASMAYGLLSEIREARGQTADPDLAVQDVGNLPLLLLAHGAYTELVGESIWPEGVVLWLYFNATEGTREAVQGDLAEFVESLEQLDPDQRLGFCSVWIQKLKQAVAPDGGTIH